MQTIFGHVVSTTYYEQDGTQKETINYEYDDEGKTTTEIAYDVNGNVIRAYEYDRNNNFVTVRNSITGNIKNEIEYDDNRQMVEYIYHMRTKCNFTFCQYFIVHSHTCGGAKENI